MPGTWCSSSSTTVEGLGQEKSVMFVRCSLVTRFEEMRMGGGVKRKWYNTESEGTKPMFYENV